MYLWGINTLQHIRNKDILIRGKVSGFPGRKVRCAFLHDRNAYSIPRIEELARVALSMNWILQQIIIERLS